MLRVVYEHREDLAPGRDVDIIETRGRVDIRIRQDADVGDLIRALNSDLKEFVARCSWFQIWRGQIVSAASPENPLSVEYEADPAVDRRTCVQIRESRGMVRVHVYPHATTQEFVRAVNPAVERFLAGGQWFQLWEGEIVTMDSPPDSLAA